MEIILLVKWSPTCWTDVLPIWPFASMHLHCKLCHTSTTTDNRAKWMNTRFSETLWCIKTDLSFTTLLKNMTNVQEKETAFAMIQVANKYPHQSRVIYNLHLLWNILQSNGEIQTFVLTWSTIATFYRHIDLKRRSHIGDDWSAADVLITSPNQVNPFLFHGNSVKAI
jgi:hypothetical protein